MPTKIRNIHSPLLNTIRLFTDGSASPRKGSGAWAACIVSDCDEQMLTGTAREVTHHTMELQAVIEGLRASIDRKNYDRIEVYTDSEYIINLPGRRSRLEKKGFMTRRGEPVKNSPMIRRLYELLDRYPVELIKVESHARAGQDEITDYNRRVDKKSRELLRKITREK